LYAYSIGGMILTGETEVLRKKPDTVPLCPIQVVHVLVWVRSRVFEVRI